MNLSDFTAIIQLLVGFYFALFGLQTTRIISRNKYMDLISKKDSVRNFIESKSQIPMMEDEWEKFKSINKYVKRFENHFDKSNDIFEEMFIYSGFYGFIILFVSVFYDNKASIGILGNTGLLYFNIFFVLTLGDVFRKLYRDNIVLYSTFRLVIYSTSLFAIFVISIFLNKYVLFNFLDFLPHIWFVAPTLCLIALSYFLFYYRWKSNTSTLTREIDQIEELINNFSNNSKVYIKSNIN